MEREERSQTWEPHLLAWSHQGSSHDGRLCCLPCLFLTGFQWFLDSVVRVHRLGLMNQNLLLTSFKLEMRPEEELERPKRFSMVVRLLLK